MLKNLKQLLENQTGLTFPGNPDVAICEFQYHGKPWNKKRTLTAIRIVTEWMEVTMMGIKQWLSLIKFYISPIRNAN
jgi:hypothetical protein